MDPTIPWFFIAISGLILVESTILHGASVEWHRRSIERYSGLIEHWRKNQDSPRWIPAISKVELAILRFALGFLLFGARLNKSRLWRAFEIVTPCGMIAMSVAVLILR